MAPILENVYFTYKRNKSILSDVNFVAPKCSITALLGPSGCGKTTLFKVVLGLLKPESGVVRVFGYPTGTRESGIPGYGIGYMPEQTALQFDLTIGEILFYFGAILCLPTDRLKRRINYLISSLELPEKSRIIGKTSGGEQKRLSLAISILHKPRLLILDEPTVGIDPVLSNKLWNIILSLKRKENATILMSTHYIEEARKANIVAFMRKGEILEQDSPDNFLNKYNRHSLESVFLQLSQTQNVIQKSTKQNMLRTEDFYVKEPLEEVKLSRFKVVRPLTAVIYKYYLEMRRNIFVVVFLFLCALVTPNLVTIGIGRMPNALPVSFVVNDNRSFYDEPYQNETFPFIPDFLVESLSKQTIRLMRYTNFSLAMEHLKTGVVNGVISLNSNFSRCYIEVDPYFNFNDEFIDNETLNCASIHVHIDKTNRIVSDVIEISMKIALPKLEKEVAKFYNVNTKFVEPSLQFVPIYGSAEINEKDIFGMNNFVGPGAIVMTAYSYGIFSSMINSLMEQNNQMLVRNFVSGVSSVHLITAQFIVRNALMFISNCISLFSSIYFLNLPCYSSHWITLTLLCTTSAVGILEGILVPILVPNSIFCIFCIIGLSFYVVWMAGILWAIESQPYYIRWLQYVLPLALPSNSMRSLMIKQNAPFHPLIWPGFLMNFSWICLLFICCVYFMKLKK